jgi:RND superfamily putative drug exporter
MYIVGPAMWWMPSWLERRLPRLAIEPDDSFHPDEALRARRDQEAAPATT